MPGAITNASNSGFAFVEETTWSITPTNPVFKRMRFTGEGLSPNLEVTQSEAINPIPDISDTTPTVSNAGGDVNFELYYSSEMDTILEHAVRGTFNGNVLKASNEFKSLTLRKNMLNEARELVYDYPGSRVNTFNLDITAEGGLIGGTVNFASFSEIDQDNYFVYQNASDPIQEFGTDTGIWINESTGDVFLRTKTAWGSVAIGQFTSGETWLSGAVDPTTEGSDGNFYLNTATGEHFEKITGTWTSLFVFNPSTWTASTSAPTGGSVGDLHLNTSNTAVYQKIDKGLTQDWQIIAYYNLTSATNWYTGNTFTAAATTSTMNVPQLRDVVVIADGVQCFTDLSFSINNNVENIPAICTDTTSYPDITSKDARYGKRETTGNMTLLVSDNELYRKFKTNTETSLEFILSDGISGYKFEFHRIKFTEGSVTATGNNTSVENPLTYSALLDPVEETALTITKIPDINNP